ncbi:MAG: HAD-IC family P-type ATPase [Streptosporangiaceae bacterium]
MSLSARVGGVAADLADTGLSSAQVAERVSAGQINDPGGQPTRTIAQIARANVLTRFNAILGGLFAVIVLVGPLQDGLFGLVLVANSGIGIIQELRAKRTLDRLSVLNAPTARVVRDGSLAQIPAARVVLGEVIDLAPGDQIVVDGLVLRSFGLEIDESLLSGEAEPVGKPPEARVLSGSFVVAGGGRIVAEQIGVTSYAARLASQARSYTPARSEIRDAINRLLTWISWPLIPVGALLVASQLNSGQSVSAALRASVAGLVGMVPEGLVLLTSVAMAVGVIRLAARRVLVQDLPAIEGLARVDVVCCDKTGTLTAGRMHVVSVIPAGGPGDAVPAGGSVPAGDDAVPTDPEVAAALGALAVADPRQNATTAALAVAFADPGWRPGRTVAFSSARKWSAAHYPGRGTWLFGAPEMLLPGRPDGADAAVALSRAGRLAADGYRVLLLARAPGEPSGQELPAGVEPVALVTLQERIRPDAEATLRYFARQGVSVRVISGDHPATVGAIARRLGLPGADQVVDARDLPADPESLARAVGEATVIGRVAPHQKQAIIAAIQGLGHVVAMTGDGVNDVLALKSCDVGIAMGSGTPAARGVARLVLLGDEFATLPEVVAEGRRLIGNVDRVSRLFLTKTVYAVLIAVVVAGATVPYPFYPRHLTIISTLSIGVPAFFLALAPNAARVEPGFLGRALRFAIPAGVMIAAAVLVVYFAVSGLGLGLGAARTSAVVTATCLSLGVLARLARPLASWRGVLVLALAGVFAALFALPWLRDQLAIVVLRPAILAFSIGVAIAGFGILLMAWPVADRLGRPGRPADRRSSREDVR